MNLITRIARLEAVLTGGPCRDAWHASSHPAHLVYPGGDPFNRPLQPPPADASCPTCGAVELVEVFYVRDWRGVAPGDCLGADGGAAAAAESAGRWSAGRVGSVARFARGPPPSR